MVSTNADAQNAGYNRLQNVTTGHVAQLSGGLRFAPDVTLEQAYAKPGTVAYAEFDGQKVTQLRAQGVDVVNTIVPMMKVPWAYCLRTISTTIRMRISRSMWATSTPTSIILPWMVDTSCISTLPQSHSMPVTSILISLAK